MSAHDYRKENLCAMNLNRLIKGVNWPVNQAERDRSEIRRANEDRAEERRLRAEAAMDDIASYTPDEAWNRANFGAVRRNGGGER